MSRELWFQQDGATCHTARATIDLLKDTFGDRLISRFGPVSWPPRSCVLTPLDYFLWGYVQSSVYADKPQTLDHLEDNIRRVIADIRPQMLEKVIENATSRLDYIRASRGSPMPEIIFKIITSNFPPGPTGLPILGYLPFLSEDIHLDLIELGKKYGDVFSLPLGSQNFVILHGADAIKEAFAKPELLGRPPNADLEIVNRFKLDIAPATRSKRFMHLINWTQYRNNSCGPRPTVPISVYETLGAGVHVQMFRSNGQSDKKSPVFSSHKQAWFSYTSPSKVNQPPEKKPVSLLVSSQFFNSDCYELRKPFKNYFIFNI
ncbi:hypothetical protein TNCV_2688951 [Trichonephila clavipes]|nr:hypothetical protein TNCV_2688951 [Trichonephila clavipes]